MNGENQDQLEPVDSRPVCETFLSDLAPRAQNLLDAAYQLLLDEGYEGLSWAKVAQKAGEQKSMIGYYFGDKQSLILELLKLIGRENTTWLLEQSEDIREQSHRVALLLERLKGVTGGSASLAFFDVLPHAIRDEKLRRPVAQLYTWYCIMILRAFGFERGAEKDPQIAALSWLFIAACDGILIQRALAPEGYPVDTVYEKLEQAIECLLTARAENSL